MIVYRYTKLKMELLIAATPPPPPPPPPPSSSLLLLLLLLLMLLLLLLYTLKNYRVKIPRSSIDLHHSKILVSGCTVISISDVRVSVLFLP